MPCPDSKTSGCVDDDPPTLRFCLKHIVLAIAAGQGAVAFFRYAVGDFWGALTDALICFTGFLCIYEFEALYVLFYCLSCGLGCCLSLGMALLMWLQKDLVRSQRLDMICASASAAVAALGVCVSLPLWDNMQRNCGNDFIRSAFASLTYGSLKEMDAGPDPFLLQEDGQLKN